MDAVKGTGRIQWNAGAWFGTLLGLTLWLVLLAVGLFVTDVALGAVTLGWAAVPGVLGVLLWRMRGSLLPYFATQLLVLVTGVAALGAFLCIDAGGHLDILRREAFNPTDQVWPWLLVYPALMMVLYLVERAARRRAEEDGE